MVHQTVTAAEELSVDVRNKGGKMSLSISVEHVNSFRFLGITITEDWS